MSFHRPRYLLTVIASVVLALSFIVIALVSTGIVANGGIWRILMIPAYLTMLAGAVLATTLSVPNSPFLLLVGVALLILPIATVDWLLLRRHRRELPAA